MSRDTLTRFMLRMASSIAAENAIQRRRRITARRRRIPQNPMGSTAASASFRRKNSIQLLERAALHNCSQAKIVVRQIQGTLLARVARDEFRTLARNVPGFFAGLG